MLEIRNTSVRLTEMKNDFGVPISKLNMSEDRIGELEGSSTETTQTEIQRKKNEKKRGTNMWELGDNFKCGSIHIIGIPEGKERKGSRKNIWINNDKELSKINNRPQTT